MSENRYTVLSAAVRDVVAERRRQVEAEGFTPEHDDDHDAGELAGAGACYAANAACLLHPFNGTEMEAPLEFFWSWDERWWKPSTDHPRRDLIKAAALIVAEIERIDRAGDACPVCAVLFKPCDSCATDIELGKCHAVCLEGAPTVDLDTGEPVDGPIPTYPHVPDERDAGSSAPAALPQAEPGWRVKVHGVSLAVATALVETFGGEETDMTVAFIENGHSGPGFYSWCTEYPEEGAEFLGQASEYSTLSTAPTPAIEEGRSDPTAVDTDTPRVYEDAIAEDEVADLKAEVERLKGALAPFGEFAGYLSSKNELDDDVVAQTRVSTEFGAAVAMLTVRQFRAARAALPKSLDEVSGNGR